MFRSAIIGSVALAAAGMLPQTIPAASAQPVATDATGSITVLAPRVRQTGRSPTTGAPIETLTSQSIVNVADLNLRTPAGRDELAARISAAAGRACDWLNEVYPSGPTTTPPDSECRAEAIKRAQSQVDAAIALANR